MEELHKFEITSYLVEELERKVLRSFSNEEDDFYMQKFYSPFDPIVLDRKIQGPLLDYFMKYIYTRTKPLNATEINNWLNISLNQFKTHSPDQRKETLREAYFQVYYYGTYKTRKPTETDNYVNRFFELIFESYKRNFYLFEQAAEQARSDFKDGLLGSTNIISPTKVDDKKKLRTNLTVAELAYLFKAMLSEGFITSRKNSEIYSFISDNFSSKKQEKISPNTIKNHFEATDNATLTAWQVNFGKLALKAKKDKENQTS